MKKIILGKVLFAILISTQTLFAAPQFSLETELNPTSSIPTELFGFSVAISGNISVVGAPSFNESAIPGSVSIFVRTHNGWTFQERIVASDSSAGDRFGWAVAISGNTLAVAALNRRADGKVGAVYVFERQGNHWSEKNIIISSDSRPFGFAVALERRTLVVGALEDHLELGGISDAGLAYVFVRSGDSLIQYY
jgi:hypothetical protein